MHGRMSSTEASSSSFPVFVSISDMNSTPKLEIRLDANGVAAPAQRAAWQCNEIVAFCLQAARESDFAGQPKIETEGMAYHLTGPEMETAERLQLYESWLLSKGFHEQARGVRETLEEAVFYLEMLKYRPAETTWGEFQAHLAGIRKRAGDLNFPALLEEVNAGLTSSMTFNDEFASFQKVRNCMEHRGGIVGERDIDDSGHLRLRLPRLKLFYNNPAGEEVELAAGTIIDTHEHTGMAEMLIRRDTRVKTYALGEKVCFTAAEFNEFAFACHLFAADVASKLPGRQELTEEEVNG